MTAGNIFEYLLSIFSLIALPIVYICRNAIKVSNEVENKMKENFKYSYKEFGNAIPSISIEEPAFKLATEKLYSFHGDVSTLAKTQDELRLILSVSVFGLVIVLLSFIIGFLIIGHENIEAILVFKYVIPIVVFIFELLLLYKSIRNEGIIEKFKIDLESEIESYKGIG